MKIMGYKKSPPKRGFFNQLIIKIKSSLEEKPKCAFNDLNFIILTNLIKINEIRKYFLNFFKKILSAIVQNKYLIFIS